MALKFPQGSNRNVSALFRLQKHVDSVHNKIKNFACELCEYRCAEKGSLKIHVQASVGDSRRFLLLVLFTVCFFHRSCTSG